MLNPHSYYNQGNEFPLLYQNHSSVDNTSFLPKLISPFPNQDSLKFKELPLEKCLIIEI